MVVSETVPGRQAGCPALVRPVLLQAAVTVLSTTVLMIMVTWSGCLDTATVELGLDHYAEKPLSWWPADVGVEMPLNTAINFGYVVCGLIWCHTAWKAHLRGTIQDKDAFFFFVFSGFGFIYGFVQLYRILAQTVASAIMDQWYTLPFFMLVFVWAQSVQGQRSWANFAAWMCASVVSYAATLLTPVGFELALGGHVLLAVWGGWRLYRERPSGPALSAFLCALLCCCGFVGLKLLDHDLPQLHWAFSHVSGHFLSKICDVLQIHFVCHFFFCTVSGTSQAASATGAGRNVRVKTN